MGFVDQRLQAGGRDARCDRPDVGRGLARNPDAQQFGEKHDEGGQPRRYLFAIFSDRDGGNSRRSLLGGNIQPVAAPFTLQLEQAGAMRRQRSERRTLAGRQCVFEQGAGQCRFLLLQPGFGLVGGRRAEPESLAAAAQRGRQRHRAL